VNSVRVAVLAVATVALGGLIGFACAADSGSASGEQASFGAKVFVRGVGEAVHAAAPRSEPNRLYVVDQSGVIRIVERGRVLAAPFLNIRSKVRDSGEQGLFSIAFHPQYKQNHRFYVQYTDLTGSTVVAEYRSKGLRAMAGSARQLFFSRDPYQNHNGGQLAFGPNGRLYFTMGDGGSGGDPENRAQNMRSLFGKLLSIDVNTRRVRIEALGLRNAWRFSFDRANGDLYIGDVGQGSYEEIDYRPRSKTGLANYGWDVYEGNEKFEDKSPGPGELVFPIAVYGHNNGCSVTGGFVYRGAIASLRGRYIFGDYCSGYIWSLEVKDGKSTGERRESFQIASLTSFGEDATGELYATSHEGVVYRLTQ